MHLQKVVDPIHGRVTHLGLTAEHAGEEVFLKAVLEGYYGQSSFNIATYAPDENGQVTRTEQVFYSPTLLAIIQANKNMEGGDDELT